MPNPNYGSSSARTLPGRPNLEHLKNEAKQRLEALRRANPAAKLADAQFQLAREYGFASWRELKTDVERRGGLAGPDPTGDWISGESAPGRPRIALHVRRTRSGLEASVDNPDYAVFDVPVDRVDIDGDTLRLALANANANVLYEAQWDAGEQRWNGVWRANDIPMPVSFARGVYPPAPVVQGLDGIWDGRLEAEGRRPGLTFRIRTDAHGTHAWCDSPDGSGMNLPARAILREGDHVVIFMQTLRVEGEIEAGRIQARFVREGQKVLPLTLLRRAPGAASPFLPDTVELPPEVLKRYVGTYAMRGGGTMAVTLEDGGLLAQGEGQPKLPLLPIGEREFAIKGVNGKAEFELDPQGKVAALVTRHQDREFRAERVS